MNSALPRLINAVTISQWYDQRTGTTHLSDGLTDDQRPDRLTGYDGPRALMLEEHQMWGWDQVDPAMLARPGWWRDYLMEMPEESDGAIRREDHPHIVIADLEAIRLNQAHPVRLGEAVVYTRECLYAIRQTVGSAGRVVLYDFPYQDGPGADESYLSWVMPEILPLVDAIGCLVYLRAPKDHGGQYEYLSQHIKRCAKWAGGKPVHGIYWDRFIDGEKPISDSDDREIFDACCDGGISTIYRWDHIATPADFDRIQARTLIIKATMRKAWAAAAEDPAKTPAT